MAGKWGRKAVLAVEKSDDDLAREALKRKRSYEDISHEFQAQWTEQKKVTDVLRENLFGLESKIDEARRKKSLLVARQKRAVAQKKLQDTLEQASTDQSYWMLGQFEDKITEIEARAEAEIDLIDGELSGRFRELETHPENVEDELSQLKSQVAGRKATDQKLLSTELDEKDAALAEQKKRVEAEAVEASKLAVSIEAAPAPAEAPPSSDKKSDTSDEGTPSKSGNSQEADDAAAVELLRRVKELGEYARTGVRTPRVSGRCAGANPRRWID
jgi:phage shock protein A